MRKFFKSKFSGRTPESNQENTGQTQPTGVQAPPARAPKDRHGLIPLYPIPNSAPANDNVSTSECYPVDIVAIHGLSGDAYTTWEDPSSGKLWLRDFLPSILPGCRVFSFAYPADVFSGAFAGIDQFAKRLLLDIVNIQQKTKGPPRSIIFICHSLGGIVFKQALMVAARTDRQYGQVLKSLIGVVFLGTPHRGSGSAGLAGVLGTIVNTLSTTASAGLRTRVARTDLLANLSRNSEKLNELNEAVLRELRGISIITVHEDRPTAPLSKMVVDRDSATLAIYEEQVISLFRDHRDICRFAEVEGDCEALMLPIQRIAMKTVVENTVSEKLGSEQLVYELPVSERPSSHSSQRSFSEMERKCVKALKLITTDGFDSEEINFALTKPVPGTCQWIRKDDAFVSWGANKSENALLWLTGHPGCGKTTLCNSLFQHLEESLVELKPKNILMYQCSAANGKPSDGSSILASLIFQIVDRRRSMISYVQRAYESHGPGGMRSFASLWRIFRRILEDPKIGPCYILLDAMDECEKGSCRQLLDCISDLLSQPSGSSMEPPSEKASVKFLLTSRPFLYETLGRGGGSTQARITIDERQTGYVSDLQRYITERIEDMAQSRGYSNQVKDYLLQTLTSGADKTFLWTQMVLSAIEQNLLTSLQDFQRITASIPAELAKTYERYLSTIPADHQAYASKLLKLILAGARLLYLDELNIAFTVTEEHRSFGDVLRELQSAISFTFQSILGPLIRISGALVSLVHQSFREYLLNATGRPGDFANTYKIDDGNSAREMANSCINFLLLEDFEIDIFESDSNPASLEGSPVDEVSPVFKKVTEDKLVDLYDDDDDDDGPMGLDFNLGLDDIFVSTQTHDFVICERIASRYKFYSYAALHWAEHFSQCEETLSEPVKEKVRTLLEQDSVHCQNWLRFYVLHSGDDSEAFARLQNEQPEVLASYFNLDATLKDLISERDTSVAVLNQGLRWAASRGHGRIVERVLVAGADPNFKTADLQTPLIIASENGHLSCVTTLLADDRTNVNLKGWRGGDALSHASRNGYEEIASRLMAHKQCNADQPDESGATPFMRAVGNGHASIAMKLAARRDVNINHQDKTGRTAISWASEEGLEDALKRIIRLKDIDCNMKDNKGRAPLSWAAGSGSAGAVATLSRRKDIELKTWDEDKRNPISWACAGGHHAALEKLLERSTSGVDEEDIDGWVPLAWAIQKDSPETVQALISTGHVDLERRDRSGRTALSWAVEYGQFLVVKKLLELGADLEAVDSRGRTPLMIAQTFKAEKIINELMKYAKSGQTRHELGE